MANAARGEVNLQVNDQTFRLCLTLGALAEIEEALGATGLADLGKQMENLSARSLISVLTALMQGGGSDVTDEEVSRMSLQIADVSAVIAKAFAAAMPEGEGGQNGSAAGNAKRSPGATG